MDMKQMAKSKTTPEGQAPEPAPTGSAKEATTMTTTTKPKTTTPATSATPAKSQREVWIQTKAATGEFYAAYYDAVVANKIRRPGLLYKTAAEVREEAKRKGWKIVPAPKPVTSSAKPAAKTTGKPASSAKPAANAKTAGAKSRRVPKPRSVTPAAPVEPPAVPPAPAS
jgi:hypothetical protein